MYRRHPRPRSPIVTARFRPVVAAVAAAVLTVKLAACQAAGGGSADREASPATNQPSAPAPGAAAGEFGTMGGGRDIPAIPEIVVPDVTTLTKSAQKINAVFGPLADPGKGIIVTGAVCDGKGNVTNGSSLTTVGGQPSRVDTADRSTVNNGDGSGRHDDPASSVVINGDGSGRYDDAGLSIVINADGSGRYDTDAVSVVLNGDGSGRYDDVGISIVNHGDGSGRYDDVGISIVINADGSGRYDTPELSVVNDGKGGGTYMSGTVTEKRRMDPMPRLAKVGKFPPVRSLKPIGSNCGNLIRFEDRVLFDFGSVELRPDAGPALDAAAKAAKSVLSTIQINGHTDSIGSDASNNELSVRRAQAVAKALAERGVTAHLETKGFGESQPVAPNTIDGKDNPAGRQLNRRVDLVLPTG
jgi:OOP family OmpA-OmpF porin